MPRYKVDFDGVDGLLNVLGSTPARRLKQSLDDVLEDGIKDMAETSYELAPIETGALKQSILGSVTKLSRHHYMYGSSLPYAQRQEYEHKTKKFYFRRSVLLHKDEINKTITGLVRSYFVR
jgi:hypothetical protein